MESLKNTIDKIVNIADSKTFPFSENESRLYHCLKCKEMVEFPMQTGRGHLFCGTCSQSDCNNHSQSSYFDKRIDKIMHSNVTKCHFHDNGCLWSRSISLYEQHLLHDCIYTQHECPNCTEIVCLKNIKQHLKTEKCTKYWNEHVQCPLKCGYENQRWIVTSHETEGCSHMSRKCPSEEYTFVPCSEHESEKSKIECIVNHADIIMDAHGKRTNQSFAFKIGFPFEKHSKAIIVCQSFHIMNNVNAFLILTHGTESLYLHAEIEMYDFKDDMSEILKNTRVMITLKDTFPNKESIEHRMMLPLTRHSNDIAIYCIPKFIPLQILSQRWKPTVVSHYMFIFGIVIDLMYPKHVSKTFQKEQ